MAIVFGYDVWLPDGPLGNGNLHLDWYRRDGSLPYKIGGIYFSLRDAGVGNPLPISLVTTRFVYAMATASNIAQFFAASQSDATAMFHGMSAQALAALRDRRAILLLDCGTEGDCNNFDYVFTRIYEACKAMEFALADVIFACGNLDCQTFHAQWLSQHQSSDTIAVRPVNAFRQFIGTRIRMRPGNFVDEPAVHRNRGKHFLCYNRRPRTHRFVVASQLLKHLSKTHLSFPPRDFSEKMTASWQPDHPTLADDLQHLDALRPLIVDQEDFETNHALTHVAWPYLDSYISLTTETVFEDSLGVFLSEKTYRPIANLQPFILIGSPCSLRYLREMGFRTFAPFIDERYDEELDHQRRMMLILAEIDRLAAMPLDVIHNWYCSILPDLRHNKQLLLDTPDQYADVTEVLVKKLND